MAHENGIITRPVQVSKDIYPVLGISRREDGYALAYACYNTHKQINMFSKIKPVRYSKPSHEDDPEWFKGDMGDNYGFLLTDGTAIVSSLPTFGTVDGIAKWIYNPPKSGEWARSLDFDGYNHYADAPIHFNMNQLINKDGQSMYRLYYSQANADIPFSEFFKYNPASATNPEYRLAFIYRTKDTLPSNYQFVLSPPNHKWGSSDYYQMDINSWLLDAGKQVELSVYLTLVKETTIPSNVENSGLSKITPLIPLVFEDAGDKMEYLRLFTNEEAYVEPITIDEVDLLANKASVPGTWVITFRIYFHSSKGNSVTLDLSQYTIELYCGSWNGQFKLPSGVISNDLVFEGLSGSATASGTGISSVTAKITYSPQPVANYIMHSFADGSTGSDGFPKGNVAFYLIRKSDKKKMFIEDIDYHNYVPITIS